jgi:hypothetical protein
LAPSVDNSNCIAVVAAARRMSPEAADMRNFNGSILFEGKCDTRPRRRCTAAALAPRRSCVWSLPLRLWEGLPVELRVSGEGAITRFR